MRTAGHASSSCLDFGESVTSQGPSLGADGAEAARCSFRHAPRPCASGFLDPVAGNTSCCPAIFMPSGIHSAPPLLGSAAKGRGGGQKAGGRGRRGAAGGRAGAGHLRRRQRGSARVARAGRPAPCQDTGIAPSPPFEGPSGSPIMLRTPARGHGAAARAAHGRARAASRPATGRPASPRKRACCGSARHGTATGNPVRRYKLWAIPLPHHLDHPSEAAVKRLASVKYAGI